MEEIVIKDNDNGNGKGKRLRQLSPHVSPRSKNSFVTPSASFWIKDNAILFIHKKLINKTSRI